MNDESSLRDPPDRKKKLTNLKKEMQYWIIPVLS